MSTLESIPTRPPEARDDEIVVSVVIPCLNEEDNIEACVRAALAALEEGGVRGARVVREPRRGYGSAYLAGFAAARGRYIVMGDADLTYDFREIPRFVETLDEGAELVMGDRMDNIH